MGRREEQSVCPIVCDGHKMISKDRVTMPWYRMASSGCSMQYAHAHQGAVLPLHTLKAERRIKGAIGNTSALVRHGHPGIQDSQHGLELLQWKEESMLACRTVRGMYNSGGGAYWMLTSPASINCIVPLYGQVHTQLLRDGLVKRNRKQHSFVFKCEIVRGVREQRCAHARDSRMGTGRSCRRGGRQ